MVCLMVGRYSIVDGLELQYNGGTTGPSIQPVQKMLAWDADQDGLPNLCEYQWSLVREAGLNGDSSSRSSVNHLIPLPAGQYRPKSRRFRW